MRAKGCHCHSNLQLQVFIFFEITLLNVQNYGITKCWNSFGNVGIEAPKEKCTPPTAILSQLGKIQERETLLIPSAVLIYSDWTTLDQKSQEPT